MSETDFLYFAFQILSTDRDQRRAGIATHMVRSAVERARQTGFKRVKCEATSKYSINCSDP